MRNNLPNHKYTYNFLLYYHKCFESYVYLHKYRQNTDWHRLQLVWGNLPNHKYTSNFLLYYHKCFESYVYLHTPRQNTDWQRLLHRPSKRHHSWGRATINLTWLHYIAANVTTLLTTFFHLRPVCSSLSFAQVIWEDVRCTAIMHQLRAGPIHPSSSSFVFRVV